MEGCGEARAGELQSICRRGLARHRASACTRCERGSVIRVGGTTKPRASLVRARRRTRTAPPATGSRASGARARQRCRCRNGGDAVAQERLQEAAVLVLHGVELTKDLVRVLVVVVG